MYSAGARRWVGGFTTLPSLLSSSQSLLSDSSLLCLSSLFLDPPARCHQVPVLSGCLHFLSFHWCATYFSSETTLSRLHALLWNSVICPQLFRDFQGFCLLRHYSHNKFNIIYILNMLIHTSCSAAKSDFEKLRSELKKKASWPNVRTNPPFTDSTCLSLSRLTLLCPPVHHGTACTEYDNRLL